MAKSNAISILNFATFDGQILFAGIRIAKELIDEQQKLVFYKSFNNEIEKIFDVEYIPIRVKVVYDASIKQVKYYYAPINEIPEWIEICEFIIDENAKAMLLYIIEATETSLDVSLDNIYSKPKII